MTQKFRPTGDVLPSQGWVTDPLYPKIDETILNDTDLVTSPVIEYTGLFNSPPLTFTVSGAVEPEQDIDWTVRVRVRQTNAVGDPQISFIVFITDVANNFSVGFIGAASGGPLTNDFQTFELNVDAGGDDGTNLIRDFSDDNIQIDIMFIPTTPATSAIVDVSWFEIELPNPPFTQPVREAVTAEIQPRQVDAIIETVTDTEAELLS